MALAGPRPAVGAGEAAGKPERAPRGPWAVPPGAASRPARPPAGPTPSPWPARPPAPRRGALAHPGPAGPSPRPPPQPGPLTRSQGDTFRRARASHGPSPQRAPSPPSPNSGSVDPPLPPLGPGLAEPVLTRSRGRTAQPGLLPARPPSPRARRGCARQEPRRDAPVLSGVRSPRHLLAWEGRCREGEAVERRRGGGGRSRGGNRIQHEGKARSPSPGVLVPNSGEERGEKSPLNPDKVKFENTCPCPRGLVAGKYPGVRLGPGPQGQGST